MTCRCLALLALVALAGQGACAFTPASFVRESPFKTFTKSAVRLSEAPSEVDLSIPYDAAARLAYDQWRVQYTKGDFDDARYAAFKANYEAISVANVRAKKAARESGQESPRLMSLNEYGDYTGAEYEAMQKGGVAAAEDVKVEDESADELAVGMDALLEDAGELLRMEEEALAKKLGYDNVDELERAIDTMEGIAEDGGMLDPDNLAREARVRSAYLEWCKQNGKEPDESRFPTFQSNFLVMEEYAIETGKEMNLNQYADCTEEEYLASTSKATGVEDKTKAQKPDVVDTAAADAEVEAKAEAESKAQAAAVIKAEAEAKAKEEAETKAKAEAEAKAKAEAEAKAKAEAIAKKRSEEEARRSMSAEEITALAEKERKERQAAQEKAAEQLRLANEAAAIASAREAAEREAAQVARRRAIDEEASQLARQKALEFEMRQKKIADERKAKIDVKARTVAGKKATPAPSARASPTRAKATMSVSQKPALEAPKLVFPDFASLFKGAEEPAKPAARKTLPMKRASVTQPIIKKGETESLSAVFRSPKPVVTPKPAAKAVTTSSPKKEWSFFGTPKAAAKPKLVPPPTPKLITPPAPAPQNKPFSFFGGSAPAPKVSPAPVPAPKAVPVTKKEPFSFFGSPKPAPKPVVTPAPKPVVTPAPAPNVFSLFGGSKPVPVSKPAPAPAPAAKENPFSFFGSPKPSPKPTPAPVAKKVPFSFLGKSAAKAATPAKKVIPIVKAAPSLSGRTIAIPKPKEETKKGSFSFFGSSSAKDTPKDDIPVLTRFVQNEDGSLTGYVSNSKNFRTGTKITTSPVRRGAQAGEVVKTSSGSQYRLK